MRYETQYRDNPNITNRHNLNHTLKQPNIDISTIYRYSTCKDEKTTSFAGAFLLSDFGRRKNRSWSGCGFLLIGLLYFCGRKFFGEIFSQFHPFWKWALKCSANTIFLSCDILPYKITFSPPISRFDVTIHITTKRTRSTAF